MRVSLRCQGGRKLRLLLELLHSLTCQDLAQSHNVKVNLDFIYGLPFQNQASFLTNIEKAIEMIRGTAKSMGIVVLD